MFTNVKIQKKPSKPFPKHSILQKRKGVSKILSIFEFCIRNLGTNLFK